MKAKDLLNLFKIVKKLEDRVLFEVATCPFNLVTNEEDRTIIYVARGEREWRLECQK